MCKYCKNLNSWERRDKEAREIIKHLFLCLTFSLLPKEKILKRAFDFVYKDLIQQNISTERNKNV